MIDMGHLYYYLGIEGTQNPSYIFMPQKKYIRKLLNKFGMVECNILTTPIQENLKLTSKQENEFDDETKYIQLVRSLICLTIYITRYAIVLSTFLTNRAT